jgi:hypothetical protein
MHAFIDRVQVVCHHAHVGPIHERDAWDARHRVHEVGTGEAFLSVLLFLLSSVLLFAAIKNQQ